MPLPLLPLIGSLVAPIVGGTIGQIASGGDKAAAAAASAKAMQYLESVGIPSIEAQQIILQNPQFVSQFTPEAETTEQMGPSAMENISTDPRLAQAQMAALESLQEQGTTPLTESERASLNQVRRNVASEEQARQGAILQNMAERGVGGGGAELAARLASSQGAAERAAGESDRLKAMAQERALAAIANAGQLGGQIRGQEFGEEAQKASAADIIAQFNAANRQNVQSRNVSARNAAAQREADIRQNLEATRAGNINQEQMYNKNLLQQNFQNQMTKAGAMSGQSNADATRNQQNAAQTAQMWSNIGSGAGQAVGTLGANYLDPNKKKTGTV